MGAAHGVENTQSSRASDSISLLELGSHVLGLGLSIDYEFCEIVIFFLHMTPFCRNVANTRKMCVMDNLKMNASME